jgi:hypothetical protein
MYERMMPLQLNSNGFAFFDKFDKLIELIVLS